MDWPNPLADGAPDAEGGSDLSRDRPLGRMLRDSGRDVWLAYQNIEIIMLFLAAEPKDQFRFASVNPAFLKATGLEAGQAVGKLAQEVIPEPVFAMVLAKYKEAARGGKTVFWEETSVYPTGEKHGEVSVRRQCGMIPATI